MDPKRSELALEARDRSLARLFGFLPLRFLQRLAPLRPAGCNSLSRNHGGVSQTRLNLPAHRDVECSSRLYLEESHSPGLSDLKGVSSSCICIEPRRLYDPEGIRALTDARCLFNCFGKSLQANGKSH